MVAFFQYRPYRKGARKAPASAPQEMPISWAMKVTLERYCTMAMTTEMAMKMTMSTRMMSTWVFSFMSFTKLSFRKSRVRVELEASTREDRVDMEGGQHQNHHNGDEHVGQSGEHGGDDGVIAVGGHVHLVGEQPPEAPQEVAPAGYDEGEHGGDDHALVDGGLALDGVELLHHLGQAPGAQAREEHHPQQVQGVGAEEGGEHAGGGGGGGVAHPGQAVQGGHEAPLAVEDGGDDGDDAHDHDDALNEVVNGGGHVAPGDDVHPGEHRHDHDAHGVVDVKGHAEQPGEAVVQRGGVGDQKTER